MYLENSKGNICAYLHPLTPVLVKEELRKNKIEVFEISEFLGNIADVNFGGIRCMTNELNSNNPQLINKLGYKK